MNNESDMISKRPKPYEFYTAKELWTDDYVSKQMLSYHLNEKVDISSRNRKFIEKSVKWIVDTFRLNANKSIADFGCGPGLYTYRLAEKGVKVTGIDFSKRSIEYAKKIAEKRNLSINYVNENYLEYKTEERFDMIIMIMCDFCALSPLQRKRMLKKFYKLLKPRGRILLDVYSLIAYQERQEQEIFERNLLDGFWAEGDYDGYLNTFKYEKEKITVDKYTIIEPSRKRVVYNWLKYFTPQELKKEVSGFGFRINGIYSNVAGDAFNPQAHEFAIVAEK